MEKVKAKKHLGQHFLIDLNAAERIANLAKPEMADNLVEVGPGMGVLTKFLLPVWSGKLLCVELDKESVAYIQKQDWNSQVQVMEADFLELDANILFSGSKTGIIGNFPYNISTQIAFRAIENVHRVSFFGGMFQKEVAKRFCSVHGNKEYGITSVLLQAYFHCKYEFTVNEGAFSPPPKVKSGVMSCVRKDVLPDCKYESLHVIVKTAFNQRRKTLSNALRGLLSSKQGFELPESYAGKRAEQLSVEDFIRLAKIWEA